MSETDWQLVKRPTGIPGLDALTHGGLPQHQATLVVGQAGTGKTVLGLQILAHAVEQGDGGVFVTFEESPAQVWRNADSFRWGSVLNGSDAWTAIDARPQPGAETSGEFDIEALLAAVAAAADRCRNPWVIIDGIDQLLQRQPKREIAIDQVRQINERCEQGGWTMLLTGKIDGEGIAPRHLEGSEFMLPTTVALSATLIDGRLNRQLRVAKYRGSGHVADTVPMVMNDHGIQLPYQVVPAYGPATAGTGRVSSGIERLDQVLGGGPYRGSSTLISGRPGTAKSTLAAGFARAAAERDERALYVSFDELEGPYVRNLASVGIDLQPHIDAGRIRFCGLSAWSSLVAEHVLLLQRLIEEFEPDCLVIDPVSALLKASGTEGPRAATERILDLARRRGITTVMTSLTNEDDPEGESTSSHVSTIADTWIVLDYNVRGGERNRSLSVVKSRGSAHSNQQRELLLSSDGMDLADVYEHGTEVLMGTARVQKESEERATVRRRDLERTRRRQDLARRIEQARSEMERLEVELELDEQEGEESDRLGREYTEHMQRRRETGDLAPGDATAGRDHDQRGGDE
ncbi:MAG: ATPase domain-containing protein [Halofilum sp. (in: g-proteobacteria)]|nr:ATPase domain-containing protein [Halofilum sp. (in: g-proteobacteria)]